MQLRHHKIYVQETSIALRIEQGMGVGVGVDVVVVGCIGGGCHGVGGSGRRGLAADIPRS